MYLQGVFQCVIKFHYCGLVSTTIAIVWCTEDCHYIAVVAPIITLEQKIIGVLPIVPIYIFQHLKFNLHLQFFELRNIMIIIIFSS